MNKLRDIFKTSHVQYYDFTYIYILLIKEITSNEK